MTIRRRKKAEWGEGSIFAMPLDDGSYAIGQVLDLMTPEVVRCAIFNEVIGSIEEKGIIRPSCNINNLIALVACGRNQLDDHHWEVFGRKKVHIKKADYPNEKLRKQDWAGARIYSTLVVHCFINAFFGFMDWDDCQEIDSLKELLTDPDKKPMNVSYNGDFEL